ncbi:hypothetical protein BKN38_01860 [Helicobacter sp. CLO-3]|nr:hypothetical protein BKN38_01860 [Helicobacter sp. CLO-3]
MTPFVGVALLCLCVWLLRACFVGATFGATMFLSLIFLPYAILNILISLYFTFCIKLIVSKICFILLYKKSP